MDSDLDVDIETVDKVGAYSDSDEDGLYFLPVEPEPDPPETEALPAAELDAAAGVAARTAVEAPGPSNRAGTNLWVLECREFLIRRGKRAWFTWVKAFFGHVSIRGF